MAEFKNKDPNWKCTFALVKNAAKESDKHPDLVLPNSDKKNSKGNFFKKNFTIDGVWCEASGYFQDDKSLKITIKKTATLGSPPPSAATNDAGFADQF